MAIEDTKETYKISSDVGRRCPACSTFLDGNRDFDDAVNHVLGHGWKLLHVGSEVGDGSDGKPVHFTVAVLGRQ
jgi:hypothetical protein